MIIVVSRIIRPQTPDLIRTAGPEIIMEPFDPSCQGNNFNAPPGVGRKSSGTWHPFEKVRNTFTFYYDLKFFLKNIFFSFFAHETFETKLSKILYIKYSVKIQIFALVNRFSE